MNTLQWRYDVDDHERVALRPFVDGQDVLAEYRNDRGVDPDELLPPTSSDLLPTAVGRVAIIGICGCGFVGCGSLSAHISRVGSEVVWAPAPRLYETLTRSYRFDLRQYLDAVDHAAADPPAGEGRGRRVGRAVRVLLARHERVHDSLPGQTGGSVDWANGWPWTSDVVQISLTVDGNQHVLEFAPGPKETDAAFADRIFREIEQRDLSGSTGA